MKKKRNVDPSVYTKNYYLNDCSGYELFKKSWGKKLEPRLRTIVSLIPSVKGLAVLDVGCGRGELAFWAASLGASVVVGIDYSEAAISLAKEAQRHLDKEVSKKIAFKNLDAKKVNKLGMKFDAVFLTEVVEHLYPEELDSIFSEIKSVLNKNGFVFVHTAPNRWFNDFTYKYWCYPMSTVLVKLSNILSGHTYGNLEHPSNIRSSSHKIMHVNEPTYFSLRNLFKTNDLYGEILSTNITVNKPELSWKDKLFNFLVYLYPISRIFPFNILWGNDFYSVLKAR